MIKSINTLLNLLLIATLLGVVFVAYYLNFSIALDALDWNWSAEEYLNASAPFRYYIFLSPYLVSGLFIGKKFNNR
ncbi:hypothetical protein AOC36_01550 [Erysipelothrix larvae]|uniref:Uncharacterized protein n=1 Tax=Erysipelothrix larvae TaxID=1514105 RepID=A0A109UGH1_9FIRM|nr:hypothetical protein [Erysipelothrix larvae]AMC92717.1 hypothetical protein AOC36_01550 [Erysipelothrix larvae]